MEDGKFRLQSESGRGGCLRRAALVTVLPVGLVLVTGAVAARFEGPRRLIERRLERLTGLDLSIGETRIGWPYDLVVREVSSAPEPPDGGELRIGELRIGLTRRFRWRITARQCTLTLAQREDGTWTPRFLAVLGDLRSLEQLGAATVALRGGGQLRVRESTMLWRGVDGTPQASAEGVAFTLVPVTVPSGRLHYYHLAVFRFWEAGGTAVREMEREWLLTAAGRFVELSYKAASGAAGSGRDLWGPAGEAPAP